MLPAYADRARWVGMMQASIAMAQERFSSDRMVARVLRPPLRAMTPPDAVEGRTSEWLDERLRRGRASVCPDTLIYDDDGRPSGSPRSTSSTWCGSSAILRWVDRLPCGSFLDVGAGCDHVPALVHERRGSEAYYADLVHQVNLPFDGERVGRLDHAVTLDLRRLPFRDGAFDVVLASEVLDTWYAPSRPSLNGHAWRESRW